MKTRHKIRIARGLRSSLILFNKCIGRAPVQTVTRGGIAWKLDLNEGIDLAIYIFGRFETDTAECLKKIVQPGFTVLDIGANVGAHTLPLAELVGNGGRVIAFEPTSYAFGKARANCDLNPRLAGRITLEQAMLTDALELPGEIYSSWPLDDTDGLNEHHCGALKSTDGAKAISIDSYLVSNGIKKVDLVKLDVDGFEVRVLRGARKLLHEYHPQIVLELAPHQFTHPGESFEDFIALLKDAGYSLFHEKTDEQLPIDAAELRKIIVQGGGINAVARK
jgi:FkbM family methyltransferase